MYIRPHFSQMKKIIITLFTFVNSFNLVAQISIKDSSVFAPLVSVGYSYQISAGDINKRFGNNSALHMNVDFKTKSNWTFGVNGSFLFGNNVKEKIFTNISTSTGEVIDRTGELADVRLYERGFTVAGTFGRLFTFNKPNPNSGVLFNVGVGLLQHKIRIETIGNNVPQLSKEYKKGYDRLSNGLLLSSDLGYLYLSSNRILNFYFGLEAMVGFTQNRRSFDYDLMKQDTQKRVDVLYGAKVAWILPLYKRAPQEFYTY